MNPVATVNLNMDRKKTSTTPAAENATRRDKYELGQIWQLELPSMRLWFAMQAPHITPVQFSVHCKSGSFRCNTLLSLQGRWAMPVHNRALVRTVDVERVYPNVRTSYYTDVIPKFTVKIVFLQSLLTYTFLIGLNESNRTML